jgi:hypothetical protein
VWEGHGTILEDGVRLHFRRDSDGSVEPWPEPGSTVHEKVRRLLGQHRDLVPQDGIGTQVAAELEQERIKAAAAELEAQARRVDAAVKEDARLSALKAQVIPQTRGWKRGTVSISINPGVDAPARKQDVNALLSPCGLWAVHKAWQASGYKLTHIASGLSAAMGGQAELKIVAVRMSMAFREDKARPSRKAVDAWAGMGLGFRRTGNPWCEEVRIA